MRNLRICELSNFYFCVCFQKTLRDNETNNSTEKLPKNWNENSAAYALRYVHENKVYILLGTVANDTIILNLLVRIIEGKIDRKKEREREKSNNITECQFT